MEDQAPSRFAAFRRGLRGGLRTALDVALPPLCPACREPVEDQALCAGCWSKLSFIARPYCERLGIPFAYDAGPGLLSMQAMADPPAYNRARAAVRYDDIARALVHAFKYGDRIDLAPTLGRWIASAGRELLAEADALIPVPLHWRRLWARCFNQSASLAKAISAASGVPVLHARAQAREGHGASGWTQPNRARGKRAGRVPRAARKQGRDRRAAAGAGG